MGKFLILCAAVFCLSLTANANDIRDTNATLGVSNAPADSSAPEAEAEAAAPAPVPLFASDRQPWQVAAGFNYDHFKLYSASFRNIGYHADVTRFIRNWLGIEGSVHTGFGHTGTTPSIPKSLVAKSFFVGGGPHISVTDRAHFEPWVHALVGLEHFRFTQTNNTLGLGSNSGLGYMLGGGIDFKIGRAAWRVQGDYLGTHFQSAFQTNYSIGTGIVFNF